MSEIKSLKELSQNFSILFVEDDANLRNSTLEIFESLFKYSATAQNGEVALKAYNEYFYEYGKNFDIVITDIQMPIMDGITLSKKILKIDKKQKIIILSAHDDKRYLLELVNMGISGFINKPFEVQQMLNILNELCSELLTQEEDSRFLKLDNTFKWDYKSTTLYKFEEVVRLSKNEKSLLTLLANNLNMKLTNLEIFESIYQDNFNKEYSVDSIKSLIKRLRKKLPSNIITSTPHAGYSLKIIN